MLKMVSNNEKDIHVLRYFSSFVSVSEGKVINVTDPYITYCPLAGHLYKNLRKVSALDKSVIKEEIKKVIEAKIKDYGFFTDNRSFKKAVPAIPYGASEILMSALNKGVIDSAVIVSDGAGTVIADSGDVVEGIGARMNTLLITSPIEKTIKRLKSLGCIVVSSNAGIDQGRGVEKAIRHGYQNISVTVSACESASLKRLRQIEAEHDIKLSILVICTTGATAKNISDIRRYADIVWSCASMDVRKKIGVESILQISKQIPVFVLTKQGLKVAGAYGQDKAIFSGLNEGKQYLISNEPKGQKIKLGSYSCFLRAETLPFLSKKVL